MAWIDAGHVSELVLPLLFKLYLLLKSKRSLVVLELDQVTLVMAYVSLPKRLQVARLLSQVLSCYLVMTNAVGAIVTSWVVANKPHVPDHFECFLAHTQLTTPPSPVQIHSYLVAACQSRLSVSC